MNNRWTILYYQNISLTKLFDSHCRGEMEERNIYILPVFDFIKKNSYTMFLTYDIVYMKREAGLDS